MIIFHHKNMNSKMLEVLHKNETILTINNIFMRIYYYMPNYNNGHNDKILFLTELDNEISDEIF